MSPTRWTIGNRSQRGNERDSSPSSDDETEELLPSSETLPLRRTPPSASQGLRSTTSGVPRRPSIPLRSNGDRDQEPERPTDISGNGGLLPRRKMLVKEQARKKRWQGFADRFKTIVDETHLLNRGKRPIPERYDGDDD